MRTALRLAALTLALFVAAAAPVALAQDAHEGVAAEHEGAAHQEGHVNVLQLVAGFVNFAILLGILVYLARKPTQAFLVSRRAAVVEGLAEAEKMKIAAEAKYDEYQKRLANLDAELAQIKEEIIASGETDRQAIVAEAERKASRLRRETEFLIEQQLKQLRVDLTKETVEAAMLAAEKVLRERATGDDQQRLAKAYLAKLGPATRPSNAPPRPSTPPGAAPAGGAASGSQGGAA